MPFSQDRPEAAPWKTVLTLSGLVLLYWGVRLWLISSPSLSQVDYDEAVTGLMALDIVKGNHHLLFWGQPYMGCLEAYLAAGLFKLFGPSTFVLRMSLLIYGSLGVPALFGLGRAAGGWWAGVLAAGLWSLPPLFMGFMGVYVTGGHLEAVIAGAVVLWGACRLAFSPPCRSWLWALGMGLAAGLGLWSSLMALPLLAAAGLGLVLARPAWLRTSGPWWLGLGFLAGAAPLIVWNAQHHWLTLVQLGGSKLSGLAANVSMLFDNVWTKVLVGSWWDGRSVARDMPAWLPDMVLWIIYLPSMGLALWTMAGWLGRGWRRRRPWQGPRDLVVLAMLLLLFIHAASGYGNKAIMRYAAPMMVPLTVLAALWIRQLAHWRPKAGVVLLTVLLSFNLYTHYLYIKRFAQHLHRPVEMAIDHLHEQGVAFGYAHGRVALPLTFESEGRILAADFFGARNHAHLRRVDKAKKPAIMAHQRLAGPHPDVMEKALECLGVSKDPLEVADYVVWHEFPSAPVLAPLSSDTWSAVEAGGKPPPVDDRDMSTVWRADPDNPSGLLLDLGSVREVARISLLPGITWPGRSGMYYQVRVEGSKDGSNWHEIAGGDVCMAGLDWRRRRVKLESAPALQFNFAPIRVRWLRLAFNPIPQNWPPMEVAEVFIYRPSPSPSIWPAVARREMAQGRKTLAAWHQKPTAPFPGGHATFARFWASQVDWPRLADHLKAAARAAPQWEEPFRLQLEAARKGQQEARSLLLAQRPCPPID